MLDLRHIAVQGVGYGPRSTAVQGFDRIIESIVIDGGGVIKSTAWDFAPSKAQLLHRQRLIEEDQLATEFILTLMTTGFFNG